jgi:hypothetical protein
MVMGRVLEPEKRVLEAILALIRKTLGKGLAVSKRFFRITSKSACGGSLPLT